MTKSLKEIALALGIFAVGLLVGVFAFGGGAHFGGSPLQYEQQYFGNKVVIGGSTASLRTAPYIGGTETTVLTNSGVLTVNTSTVTGNLTETGNQTISGSLTIGGTASANQINIVAIATSSLGSFTLGALGTTSSTASTTISIAVSGLAAGDPCIAGLSSATTSGGFGVLCNVYAAAAANATATVSEYNLTPANLFISTGTARIEVHHEAL